MAVTATYNQITSATNTWVGTFKMGGIYYAINSSGTLYSVSGGVATSLRTVSGDVWGAVRCDGTYIYRANGSYLYKIDPLTGTVAASSALSGIRSIALDVGGARVFALLNSGALYVFTTNNLTQYYVNNVGAATYGPGLCYLNGALYIPVYGGKIKKYVVDTGVLTTLNNSLSANWLCMDTDGTYLYATVDNGRIYKIDPTDVTTYEEVQGDSTGRSWYSCFFDSASPSGIWANAYNGYCYNIQLGPAIPTASVSSSTIYADTPVTLSCSTSGAVIKYTTDGTTPGLSNGTIYSSAFTISKTTTIKFCSIYNNQVSTGSTVVLTQAGLKTQVGTQNVNRQCTSYGDYLYASNAGYGIYKINVNTGVASLLIADAYYSSVYTIEYGRPIWTDGSVILVSMLSTSTVAAVGEFDMNGNLLYIHALPTNYGSCLGYFKSGSNVYVYSSNDLHPGVLYKVNLGTSTLTEMFNNLPYDLRYVVVISGAIYAINQVIDSNYALGSRPCTISLQTFNLSTGAFTLVKQFDPFILTNAGAGISSVTYDGYRIFISMYTDGIKIINMTDMSLRSMYGGTLDGSWYSLSMVNSWLYGIDSTSQYAYKFRTLLDLGTPSIYKSGAWKSENALYVRHDSAWISANKAFKVSNGLWTRIY